MNKGVIWDLCSGLGGWGEAFVQGLFEKLARFEEKCCWDGSKRNSIQCGRARFEASNSPTYQPGESPDPPTRNGG